MNQPATTTPAAAKPAAAPSKAQQITLRKEQIATLQQEFHRTLPASIPADKFVRTIQTAIQLNPDLAAATRDSVVNACMKAAADGLVLDGREAVLNVFNSKKKDASGKESWVKEAVYIPMVMGILKRVRNSGEVSRFNAFVVHKNDLFKRTLGLDPTLIHEPNDNDPGEALGAYAVCLYKDGAVDYEYMTAAQILKIGAATKNADQYDQKKGKSADEWWRKTVIRRLSKRLPMDNDLRNVVQRVDELYEPEETIDNTTGEITEKPRQRRQTKVIHASKVETPAEPAQEEAKRPAFIQDQPEPAGQGQEIEGEYEDHSGDQDSGDEDVI